MTDTIHLIIISYDVSDNANRRRVAALLETRMVRVQGSVFEGWMSVTQAHRLFNAVGALIDAADSARCYVVPRASVGRCRASGFPSASLPDGVLIL